MKGGEAPAVVVPATEEGIRRAAECLRQGGLVVFPTETVYGLGADAENSAAVRSIFEAKGRPADHPLIVHLASAGQIDDFVASVPAAARKLAAAFWPGPMTLVLRRSGRVSDLVTGGLETVGLRVPGHPVAQALLARFGGPVAAPSANRFGRVSPTCVEHVVEELDGRVDLILDGGPCQVGLESTIIDVSGDQPAVLRPGGITREQIEAVLGAPLGGPTFPAPRVSGSLPSHYAPCAQVEIVAAAELAERARQLVEAGKRVAVLTADAEAVRRAAGSGKGEQPTVLAMPQEPAQLARDLYALLRRADANGCEVVLATLPPEEGLGLAIADRLRRAAGPREPSGE